MNNKEKNYQLKYCEKYFGKGNWEQEVLNRVDVLLKGLHDDYLLYVEFKYIISNNNDLRQARAQAILTNKKQEQILERVGLAYMDSDGNDTLEIIDCSDDSVMYNNDINWRAEVASSPSKDAVERINDRIKSKVTPYKNEEIRQIYQLLRRGRETKIQITDCNINTVYNQWRNAVPFERKIDNEQELINLFLTDICNGTIYEEQVKEDITQPTLFGPQKVGEKLVGVGRPLMRENTNLSKYKLQRIGDDIRIEYAHREMYPFISAKDYDFFWQKYQRPPSYVEFIKILEHSAKLYSDQYRRDTGGEYTPTCFVELQNELLAKHGYNLNEYIVCDPCAGVGNLENEFGRDYKRYCYLSTLEQTDVDICRSKGFENSVRFDFLKDKSFPLWKYGGSEMDIREIAQFEGRKLMIVMNPPYTRQKGFSNDLAIEFFNKVVKLCPDVIVFYCKTEFFLRPVVSNFVKSKYNIVSHVFSNAKTTFKLSEWPVSLVIFDREKGDKIDKQHITASRYEVDNKDKKLHFKQICNYDNSRPPLIKEIEEKIKKSNKGLLLGQWTNQNYCLVLSERTDSNRHITTDNVKYCLLLKGINFNTHGKYFETSNLTYRGKVREIPSELFNDAIMFSQFYIGLNFTNKGNVRNYIMPFTADELGCAHNDLNVLLSIPNTEDPLYHQDEQKKPIKFDFREFLHQFDFSAEAKALYYSALKLFRYYHQNSAYTNKDWNDSYYDITNAFMHKDVDSFKALDNPDDRRITRVKTTKGTHGFGRNTIAGFVSDADLPIFNDFFDKRDTLALKINQELLDAHLLLWQRENIY